MDDAIAVNDIMSKDMRAKIHKLDTKIVQLSAKNKRLEAENKKLKSKIKRLTDVSDGCDFQKAYTSFQLHPRIE